MKNARNITNHILQTENTVFAFLVRCYLVSDFLKRKISVILLQYIGRLHAIQRRCRMSCIESAIYLAVWSVCRYNVLSDVT